MKRTYSFPLNLNLKSSFFCSLSESIPALKFRLIVMALKLPSTLSKTGPLRIIREGDAVFAIRPGGVTRLAGRREGITEGAAAKIRALPDLASLENRRLAGSALLSLMAAGAEELEEDSATGGEAEGENTAASG